MSSNKAIFSEFLNSIPEERRSAIIRLRDTILENIPDGFEERISGGMLHYVVPHSIYPKGYHCDPKLPLGFADVASQKNFIALYHMGLYGNPQLLEWFVNEYPKYSKTKLDMGKSCVRFKKTEEIPYDLIGELMRMVTVDEWIKRVESVLVKK